MFQITGKTLGKKKTVKGIDSFLPLSNSLFQNNKPLVTLEGSDNSNEPLEEVRLSVSSVMKTKEHDRESLNTYKIQGTAKVINGRTFEFIGEYIGLENSLSLQEILPEKED